MGYRPDTLPRVLSHAEREQFLEAFNRRCKTPARDYVAVRLMLDLGLRVGEVVALKPQHLDLASDPPLLHVKDGKGAKDRDLPIKDATLFRDLQEWMETRAQEWPDSEYLFPTSSGRRVSRQHLHRVVKRVAERAELASPLPSCHDLRHSFGTALYRETKDLVRVAKALGHASTSTAEIYTHLSGTDVEEGLDALAQRRQPGEEEPSGSEGGSPEVDVDEVASVLSTLDPEIRQTLAAALSIQ